jgi:hypothetical protein
MKDNKQIKYYNGCIISGNYSQLEALIMCCFKKLTYVYDDGKIDILQYLRDNNSESGESIYDAFGTIKEGENFIEKLLKFIFKDEEGENYYYSEYELHDDIEFKNGNYCYKYNNNITISSMCCYASIVINKDSTSKEYDYELKDIDDFSSFIKKLKKEERIDNTTFMVLANPCCAY